MTPPILKIQDLHVSFGATQAVRGIGLEVPARSVVSLVGESGSGKTVTALSICRLLSGGTISGAIEWRPDKQSVDLLTLPENELIHVRGSEIAYVFQDPGSSFNPVLTIGDQIVEACQTHVSFSYEEAEKKALEHLELVHLPDPVRVFESYPHELSGGMRQRAMIAMALIAGPRLLIADEPTTALDVTVESGIIRLLTELKEKKALTLLFITHDLALAMAISDKITVLSKGQVVESLSREDNFAFKNAYTQNLFTAGLLSSEPKTPIEVQ